ncbi:MAG: M20 family metallopeptidase, partial [Pseudoflavonifractor sp.]
MSFLSSAQGLAPRLLALKQDLHTHPELSFQEVRTTAILREKLTALGLEVIDLGMDTGVVALLRGGLPGKTVALRADIDAICQQEPAGPGASEVPGVMHACGHDFHAAGLYGAAILLAEERARLRGDVAFLFQPAEEITQGAAALLDHGLWAALPSPPVALFGLHNRPELPCGQVAVVEGPIMAGKIHFEIVLRGLAGHGGSPHKCIDVIVPGAAIVSALQSVVSRSTDPMDPLVCSVCSIHAGTPENFAPDLLTMTGCIRAHRDEVLEHAQERIWTLARGIGEAHGCAVEVQFIPQVPITYNSKEMTAIARRAALAVVGAEQIVAPLPDLGSEDFAVFGQEVPSFFYWLGSGRPGAQNPCWHSPDFRTDDR